LILLSLAASLAQGAATPPQNNRDLEIERAIRAKFSKSKIAEDRFTVRVAGGVATIEGKTNILQRKGVATRLARGAGALRVVNNIQITESARQKAAQTLHREARRVQVKPPPSR
jgi:hypothetical protein